MRMRLAWVSVLVVVGLVALGGAQSAAAQGAGGQVVKLGEGETLTISGFINSTWFMNNGFFGFGNSQNAEFANPVQPAADKTYLDGDVRNTRINFTFSGSPVMGKWSPRATLEADFFGAFNGAPPFGDEQPQMRIRFAYADLTNGPTTLRIGQFWAPLFNTDIPVSLAHIAFPLGLGSGGVIGWRFPGVFLYHDLTAGKPVNVQLQLAAYKGSGPFSAGNSRDSTNLIGNGQASGLPEPEARLNFARRREHLNWSGYVVGHLDWKDTTGTGVAGDNATGWGVEAGFNVAPSKLTLHGNFYYGKGLGQQFGHISQDGRPTAAAGGVGAASRIKGWGAWAQAGYDVDPHWSLWAFYGMDQPDAKKYTQETTLTLARQLSHVGDALLRYRAGRYALGLEWFRAATRWSTGPASANQYALSVLYTL